MPGGPAPPRPGPQPSGSLRTSGEPQRQVAPRPKGARDTQARDTGAGHVLPPATPTHSGHCGRQLRAPGTGSGQGLFLALWSMRLMPAHQGPWPSSVTWAFSLQNGLQGTEQERASRGRTGGGGATAGSGGEPRPPLGYSRWPQHRQGRQRRHRESTRLRTNKQQAGQGASSGDAHADPGRAGAAQGISKTWN